MRDKELRAVHKLIWELVEYYDDSTLPEPIEIGDILHSAIGSYRKSLPSEHLPPGEGEMMRELLGLSRSNDEDDRRASQDVAERWAECLMETYPELDETEPPESIPSAYRTKPMPYRKAAELLGRGNSQDAAEWLSQCVKDGTVKCESLSRQTHVFDCRDFPESVWARIKVAGKSP